MRPEEIFSRDPEVMGGELVFAGTRVPIQNLVDYLTVKDYGLDEFLVGFPGVSREQAMGFLGWAVEEARCRAGGEEEGWLERVPEPWASKLRTEIYSQALKARRVLDGASTEEDRVRARERVREMGFDPDGVPRFPSSGRSR